METDSQNRMSSTLSSKCLKRRVTKSSLVESQNINGESRTTNIMEGSETHPETIRTNGCVEDCDNLLPEDGNLKANDLSFSIDKSENNQFDMSSNSSEDLSNEFLDDSTKSETSIESLNLQIGNENKEFNEKIVVTAADIHDSAHNLEIVEVVKTPSKRSSTSENEDSSLKKIKLEGSKSKDVIVCKTLENTSTDNITSFNEDSNFFGDSMLSHESSFFETVGKKVLDEISGNSDKIVKDQEKDVEVLTQGNLSIEHLLKSNNCPLCLKWSDKIVVHVKNCAAKHKIPTDKLFDAIKLQLKQHQEREAIGLPPLAQKPPSKKKTKKKTTPETAVPKDYNSSIELAKALSVSCMENQEAFGHLEMNTEDEKKDANRSEPKNPTSAPIFSSGSSSSTSKGKCRSSLLFNRTEEDRERIVTEKVAIVLLHNDEQDNLIAESAPLIPRSSKLKETHNKEKYLAEQESMLVNDSPVESIKSASPSIIDRKIEHDGSSKQSVKSVEDVDEIQVANLLKPTKAANLPVAVSKLTKTSRSFRNNWRNLFKDKVMCDITVIVEEEFQIEVHKLVLRAHCPALLDEVITRFNPNNIMQNLVLWSKTPREVAYAFFEYIYSEDLTKVNHLNEVSLKMFMDLTEKYNISGLKFIFKDYEDVRPNPSRHVDIDEATTATNSSTDDPSHVRIVRNVGPGTSMNSIDRFDLLDDVFSENASFGKEVFPDHASADQSNLKKSGRPTAKQMLDRLGIPRKERNKVDLYGGSSTNAKSGLEVSNVLPPISEFRRRDNLDPHSLKPSLKETLTIDSNSMESVEHIEIIEDNRNKNSAIVITLSDDSDCEAIRAPLKKRAKVTRPRGGSACGFKKMYESSDSDSDKTNKSDHLKLNDSKSDEKDGSKEESTDLNNLPNASHLLGTFQSQVDWLNKSSFTSSLKERDTIDQQTEKLEYNNNLIDKESRDDYCFSNSARDGVPKSVHDFNPQMPSTSRAADIFEAWISNTTNYPFNSKSTYEPLDMYNYKAKDKSYVENVFEKRIDSKKDDSGFKTFPNMSTTGFNYKEPKRNYVYDNTAEWLVANSPTAFTSSAANRYNAIMTNSFRTEPQNSEENNLENYHQNFSTLLKSSENLPWRNKAPRKRHCSATITSAEAANNNNEPSVWDTSIKKSKISLLSVDEELFKNVKTPETSIQNEHAEIKNIENDSEPVARKCEEYSVGNSSFGLLDLSKANGDVAQALQEKNQTLPTDAGNNSASVQKLALNDFDAENLAASSISQAPALQPEPINLDADPNVGSFVTVCSVASPKPNYTKMRKKELMEELQKHGVKMSFPVAKAREILNHIYDATHPQVTAQMKKKICKREAKKTENGFPRDKTAFINGSAREELILYCFNKKKQDPDFQHEADCRKVKGAIKHLKTRGYEADSRKVANYLRYLGVVTESDEFLQIFEDLETHEKQSPFVEVPQTGNAALNYSIQAGPPQDLVYKPSNDQSNALQLDKKNESQPTDNCNDQGLSSTYRELLALENMNAIRNVEVFECPTCFDDIEVGGGIILKECTHSICKNCLSRLVETCDELQITCPCCPSVIHEREFKEIVSSEVVERYLMRSLAITKNSIENAFFCKTPDCKGWCIIDDILHLAVNEFQCPVCFQNNCIQCQAIHLNMNCLQYQNHLAIQAEKDPVAKKSLMYMEKLTKTKKAMNCPKCNIIIVKTAGCDWIQCSMCKCEICWATMGPRWGPRGAGDTSGGCRCKVNGLPCSKSCRNCH